MSKNLAFRYYMQRNQNLKTQRLSSITDESYYKRSLAATVHYAVIEFHQNVQGKEKYLDTLRKKIHKKQFWSFVFKTLKYISIFQALFKFPSQV